MRKLLGLVLGMAILAPLPSFAEVVIEDDHGTGDDHYIYNDQYLIHLKEINNSLTGRAWSDGVWSDETTVISDFTLEEDVSLSSYGGRLFELGNDTIVQYISDYGLVSYSDTHGFQYSEYNETISDVIVNNSNATLINCDGNGNEDDVTAYATVWTETDGLSTAVELAGSVCTDDLDYFSGKKHAVVDYYSGNVYDRTNAFEVIATGDLSNIGYVDESEDYDSQNYDPTIRVKKNGDVAIGFVDQLYGYAYASQTWQPVVTLDNGFTLLNEETYAESQLAVLQSGDNKQILAFAVNDDQTEYQLYRWTSADGWLKEKTYSFDVPAQLITPNIHKKASTLDWAFWLDETDELRAYRWTGEDGYKKLTTRDLSCDEECEFTLDISKKGKVFLVWQDIPALYAGAWDPATEMWEDHTLVTSGSDIIGELKRTHITDEGQWNVEYSGDNTYRSLVRWTPDNAWGNTYLEETNATYYNDDKYYTVTLDNHVLTVQRFKWKTGIKDLVDTINDVERMSFSSRSTFLYDNHLFLSYSSDNQQRLTAVEL